LRTGHECPECLVRFINSVASRITDSEEAALRLQQLATTVMAEKLFASDGPSVTTELSTAMWRKAVAPVNPDPFAEEKRASNELALALRPAMDALLEAQPSLEAQLATAIRLALLGNYIDLHASFHTGAAATPEFIHGLLEAHLDDPLGVDNLDEAVQALQAAPRVLYLFDNAGEIAFDAALIDLLVSLGKQVVGVVKLPFANNATLEDARQVGLSPRLPVVSTENNTDGLPQDWSRSTNVHFARLFREPGWLKVMKGMSLYESSTEPAFDQYGPYLHLLKLKCERILRDVEQRTGHPARLLDSVVWLRK